MLREIDARELTFGPRIGIGSYGEVRLNPMFFYSP